MADMGVADAVEKELRRLDDEWAKCAKENTAFREQLREKGTALDEWIAAYHHNTAEIRRLTDALRDAAHDATRREAGAG